MAYTLTPKLSDFRGYPSIFYEISREETFYKQGCPSNQSGSPVQFSKTYRSYVSNADAIQKMENDSSVFQSQGQAYANTNGSCVVSPAPNSVNVSGYLKAGEMDADNGWVYVIDRANHCIVAYEDIWYAPVTNTNLELKNGEAIIGVRGSAGSDQYRLNNPGKVSVSGYGCVVVNNNGKEIKVFDLNNRQGGKVAPGRLIASRPDIEFIYSAAAGALSINNVPTEVFFIARNNTNQINLYRVDYNSVDPFNVTLLRTIYPASFEYSILYARIEYTEYSSVEGIRPSPALGFSFYGNMEGNILYESFIINTNNLAVRHYMRTPPDPPGRNLLRTSITTATSTASFGVDINTMLCYNSFWKYNSGGNVVSVIQRLGNTGSYQIRDYALTMDYTAYDKALGVMYFIDVYRRNVYKTLSFHNTPSIVASDVTQ